MDEWTTYAKENGIKSGEAYEHLFDCHVHDENGIATVTMSQAIEAVRLAENEFILRLMKGLTDDERTDIFAHFCTHCGTNNPRCVCMRDE